MALDAELLEILACPDDKGALLYFADDDLLYNPRLQRKYRIEDGIPHMIVEEAELADADEHERLMAKAASEGIRPTFEE
ncbi:MAG: Trm112 family protein [Acidimicrobiia bacterium]|nr:Trm112 family protein [Acidimicrobiia bacterium]